MSTISWEERKSYYNENFFTKKCSYCNNGMAIDHDNKAFVELLLKWTNMPNSVIDCGCATGGFVCDFLSLCPMIDIVGFDLSSFAIEHCLPNAKSRLLTLDVATEPISFPDQHFDLCLAIDFYEHQDDEHIGSVIAETCRVTKQFIFIRQPFTKFNVPVEKRDELIMGYNHLSHLERLALTDKIPEITNSIPDPNCPYHPQERSRDFFIKLFAENGFSEKTLSEKDYIFPNPGRISSWSVMFLERE